MRGEWESGRVGSGGVGSREWESGREWEVGEWESGRVGDEENLALLNLGMIHLL